MREYKHVYALARLYGWRPSCTEGEFEPYLWARTWLALRQRLDAALERDVSAFADALERALPDIPEDDPFCGEIEYEQESLLEKFRGGGGKEWIDEQIVYCRRDPLEA